MSDKKKLSDVERIKAASGHLRGTLVEGLADEPTGALAEELANREVHVSIVQPGGVVSDIGAKSWPGTRARLESAPDFFEEEAEE